jgi:hypothetical protein
MTPRIQPEAAQAGKPACAKKFAKFAGSGESDASGKIQFAMA